MATTRISDVIVPPIFNPYVIQRTMELSALFSSGVILPDPEIQGLAQGAASYFDMPYFSDLGNTESNIGSDDPAVKSTPQKIGTNKDMAQKHFRNNSWSSMDLTSALLAKDPMNVIADLVAGYWARDLQRTLIGSLNGVIASNVANNSSDMLLDVSLPGAGTPGASNKISANVVLGAKQTMGDAAGGLTAIAMHSILYTALQNQQLITFIPNARGEVNIPTYLGYTVIVDDGCPVTMNNGNPVYTSFMFGRGAVGYGEGSPKVATETIRDPAAGNGEGQETLFQRKHYVMHPRGIKFLRASMAGISPTNAELAAAANWLRVYERKAVRFVAIKTNG
jgi:hypothetical protein